jgi:hypothetical protein
MAKKAPLSFTFSEELTSLDYQKIIVEQNHAIISLLAMQQDNIIHGGLNRVVQDNYAKALKPYLIKPDSNKNLKKMEENLSEQQKTMLSNLRRRKEDGENIYGIARGVGLEAFFEEN